MVEFGNLIFSPYLKDIPTQILDKSYQAFLRFDQFKINLSEDLYQQLMRTLDLNLAWTDGLDEVYCFRNEEEYFKSTAELPKSRL